MKPDVATRSQRRNVWSVFSSLIPTVITFTLVGAYLNLLLDVGFLIIGGVFLSPHLYISAEYLMNDHKAVLLETNGQVYLVRGTSEYCLDSKNISKAVLFQSRTRKDWLQFFSWQACYFVGLVTVSGQRLVITMTIAKSLEEVLKSTDLELEVEYVEFPSLFHWLD